MGVVVTVMNMKGGVGKTTLAMHIAGMLAKYQFNNKNRRVLLVDYDPQFNLSQAFIPAKIYFGLEKQKKTILSVLVENEDDIDPYHLQVPGNLTPPHVVDLAHKIYSDSTGRVLDIVPSTLELMYLALGQFDKTTKPIEERFSKFIAECKAQYDVIFIDCHPAGSLFTKTSLRNSDHVLIPVLPQQYAVRGVGLMLQFIEANKVGGRGPKPHIVFNGTGRSKIHTEEVEISSDTTFSPFCLKNRLNKYSVFTEPMGGKGFVWHSKKPYSSQAFSNLWKVVNEFSTKAGI